MAHREFTLNERESVAFQRAEQATRNVRELKRLQAVRMYGTGRPVPVIEEVVGCSWRSLMDWCQADRDNGLDGLKSHWQGDNALKLTREQRADLKTRLEQAGPQQVLSPEARLSQGQFWTISDLKPVVHQWYGIRYQSDTAYRTLLHECHFSQQQTAPQYRSRPAEQTVADFEAELEKK